MRFGKWRGVPLASSLAAILGLGLACSARADGWHFYNTIPREVAAYDFTTGGEFTAPPVPYGHYAKDSHAFGLSHLSGLLCGLGHGCGLGHCCGLFHGCGLGHGCNLGHGCGGHGAGGTDLGSGCGFCDALGLFHHGSGQDGYACYTADGHGHGLRHKKNFAPCHASTVAASPQIQPAAQAPLPSGQSFCGAPGCKVSGKHSHWGDPCPGCGGRGHLGSGGLCGLCGGCGLFRHGGGTGCGLCGGLGCANCLKGIASKAHGLLGGLMGHREKVDWFVGAGGPVPLTPGYVPYIVATRSPRDFLAFPPMNPNDP